MARAVEHALAVVGGGFILYHLFFDLSVMTSPSMAPTLQGSSLTNGDWILSERLTLLFRDLQRWEIVTFENEEGLRIMKRVVGLPHESVSLEQNRIHINGEPQPRPAHLRAVRYYPFGNLSTRRSVACGEGYYVLGDNSRDSQDSRFEGPVAPKQIRGRACCILWPPSRITWLHP